MLMTWHAPSWIASAAPCRSDRLVETDPRANHLGQLRVRQHLLLWQWLLDEQKVENVELGEVLRV